MKRQKLQVRNAENRLAGQSELLCIRMQNTWNAMNDAYKQVEIAVESILAKRVEVAWLSRELGSFAELICVKIYFLQELALLNNSYLCV